MKKTIRFLFLFVLLILTFQNFNYADSISYTEYDKYFKKLDINSDYKGASKDETVIMLQVDKLTNIFLNKKYNDKFITPNLNKLIDNENKDNKGVVYFNKYYATTVSKSSERDFAFFNSLYPHPNVDSIARNEKNKINPLPKILENHSYNTLYAFVSKIYQPNRIKSANILGFKNSFYLGSDNNSIFEKANEIIDNNKKGFYFLSLDSNSSYTAENLIENKVSNFLTNDINFINYADKNIGDLIKKIDKKKITLIIVGSNGSSSYDPNVQNDYSKIFENYGIINELNIPLLIKTSSNKDFLLSDTNCSEIDIMPNIIHLLDIKAKTYPIMGDVLFNNKLKNRCIYFQNSLKKGSYLNDEILFEVRKLNQDYSVIDLKSNKILEPSKYIENSIQAIRDIDLSNGLCDLDLLYEIFNNYTNKIKMRLDTNKTIMHAGGILKGISYSNMKDALDYGYSIGKRYFEVDFENTKDNKYVALHSWDGFLKKFFDVDPVLTKEGFKKPFSYKEFMNFKEVHGYTQMDVKIAMEWLKNHPDAYIITDCKGNNLELLKEIKSNYDGDLSRILVQIYDTKEYWGVRKLGFKNIIFTLYRTNITEEQIIKFAKNNPLYAVTIHKDRFDKGFGNSIIKSNIKLFLHTINSVENAQKYFNKGVNMIYTDAL